MVCIYKGILFSLKKEGNSVMSGMNLEDIMLKELSQIQKDKYSMISLMLWNLKKSNLKK